MEDWRKLSKLLSNAFRKLLAGELEKGKKDMTKTPIKTSENARKFYYRYRF